VRRAQAGDSGLDDAPDTVICPAGLAAVGAGPVPVEHRQDVRGPRGAAGRTLLIVDDEEDILESLSELFGLHLPGLQVLTARTGEEALALLQRRGVDLILSDFRMPGMDGIEFLRRARSLAPGTPRLLLTAYGNRDLSARAQEEAAVRATLAKPIDASQLIELTRQIVSGS
jgi:CheY-like chemotaxis protein